MSDLLVDAYIAADAARRRLRARGETVTIERMGRMVVNAHAVLRRLRSVRRIQINRERVEQSDLGGEA